MVFGCISKNFPENIFWCLEKKKENTNLEKHKPQPRSRRRSRFEIAIDGAITISPSSRDRDRRRDLTKVSRDLRKIAIDDDLDPVRSRSQSGREIAINGTISRWRDRDQRRLECLPARSRSVRTGDRDRARALSLSLSLSFSENTLKGK